MASLAAPRAPAWRRGDGRARGGGKSGSGQTAARRSGPRPPHRPL